MVVKLETLNFADFTSGPPQRRQAVAKQIADSFTHHGFVKLLNHGLADGTVQQLFDWSARLFKMHMNQKRKLLNVPCPDPQRGWSTLGAEQTSKLRRSNLKDAPNSDFLDEREHFDCGPASDSQYPNRWPDNEDLPGFREFVETFYDHAQTISLQITEACEVGLDLPPGTLVNKCVPAASELRLNHYPPVSIEKLQSRLKKRTWPHSDLGIVTLLFQDAVGGLELEDRRNGGFSPVIRDHPYEMVVNISDTLQRWTNDDLRAGLHHVTLPTPMKGQESGMLPERFSCVFFLKAHRQTSVGSLPAFVGPGKPAKYKGITALEFQQKGVKEVYSQT